MAVATWARFAMRHEWNTPIRFEVAAALRLR
jgi:hypothetical protein